MKIQYFYKLISSIQKIVESDQQSLKMLIITQMGLDK